MKAIPLRWAIGALVGSVALGVAACVALTTAETRRVHRLVPQDGKLVDIEGEQLHCVDLGEGPPIVMIHGLGGQLRNFHRLVERLSQNHRVVLVDRPGSGYSRKGRLPELSSINGQARLMLSLFEHLGLEKPLVVGHSFGGAVALSLALQAPERVSGLALIAPLTHLVETLPPAFKGLAIEPEALRRALAWTLVAPMSRWGPRAPMQQVFHPDPVPADFDDLGGGGLARRPGNYQNSAQELRAIPADLQGMTERYHQLQVPVRVLFGEGDTILAPKVHGEGLIGKYPKASLEIVPGGHMLPVTQPEKTAAWLEQAAKDFQPS